MSRKQAHSHTLQLVEAMRVYIGAHEGIGDSDLAVILDVSVSTANRYRHELGRYDVYEVSPGRYSLRPTEGMILFAHTVLNRVRLEQGNPHKPRRTPRA